MNDFYLFIKGLFHSIELQCSIQDQIELKTEVSPLVQDLLRLQSDDIAALDKHTDCIEGQLCQQWMVPLQLLELPFDLLLLVDVLN